MLIRQNSHHGHTKSNFDQKLGNTQQINDSDRHTTVEMVDEYRKVSQVKLKKDAKDIIRSARHNYNRALN